MNEIMIYDEIVPTAWSDAGYGICAKGIVQQLQQYRNEEVTVRVNSPGGSVWEAMAIESAIHQHGNVTYQVDGIAFSAASWLGVRAKKCTANKFAEIMIHDPYLMMDALVMGNAEELTALANAMLKDAERLEKDANKLAGMYAERGKWTADEFRAAMKDETWLDVTQAMDIGLIDEEIADDGKKEINVKRSVHLEQMLARAPKRVQEKVNMGKLAKPQPVLPDVIRRIAELQGFRQC